MSRRAKPQLDSAPGWLYREIIARRRVNVDGSIRHAPGASPASLAATIKTARRTSKKNPIIYGQLLGDPE